MEGNSDSFFGINRSTSSSTVFQPISFNHSLNVKLDSKIFLLWRQQAMIKIKGYQLHNFFQGSGTPPKYCTNGSISSKFFD